MERQYLSISEACAMFGLSQRAIRYWISDGRLPAVRFGQDWRIALDDLKQGVPQKGKHGRKPSTKEAQ